MADQSEENSNSSMSLKQVLGAAVTIFIIILSTWMTFSWIVGEIFYISSEKSMIVAIIPTSLLFSSIFLYSLKENPKIKCFLCYKQLRKGNYDAHRKTCLRHFSDHIASLPTLHGLNCPTCHHPMRLWPENPSHSMTFFCQNRDFCPVMSKSEIKVNGSSCYHCFQCNTFKCSMCAQNEVARLFPERQWQFGRSGAKPWEEIRVQDQPPTYDVAITMPATSKEIQDV